MNPWMKLCLGILALAPLNLPAQGKDELTLTLTATCTAGAKRADPDLPMQDNLTLTLSEQATYRIVGQGINGLELEQIRLQNARSASGGGTQGVPASPMLKPESWTYTQTRPTSPTPFGGVYIDTKAGRGRIEVNGLCAGVTVSDDSWGAPALAAAGMDFSPPTPEFRKNLEFSFDPNAPTFSKGGRATHTYTFTAPDGRSTWTATLQISYMVTRGEVRDPGEVVLEVTGYDTWVPEGNWKNPEAPGNHLRVKARVKSARDDGSPRKARLTFKLESSRQLGVCLNWPSRPAGNPEDLQFRKMDNPSLGRVTAAEAETAGEVAQAEVDIACFDYGAYGKLSLTAVDKDGNLLRVTHQGRELADLSIPRTELGGHIADVWKKGQGAETFTDDWDEAAVPLQDAKGDGLPLYAKYRGVLVLEGGARRYVRLPAKEKAHFVVDPSGVFAPQRWLASTKIRAYLLDDTLYRKERRIVDFNGENGKYAVRLDVVEDPAGKLFQYAFTDSAGSPRVADQVTIFRGRMNGMLERVLAQIQKAVTNPDSPEGREEAALLQNECGISLQEAAAALCHVDKGQLMDRLVRLAAIHEMGHACGVFNGHVKAVVKDRSGPDGKREEWVEFEESEAQVGEVLCPMQYLDGQVGRRRFILLGLLPGDGPFCQEGFECFRHLNVK